MQSGESPPWTAAGLLIIDAGRSQTVQSESWPGGDPPYKCHEWRVRFTRVCGVTCPHLRYHILS